MTKPTRVLVVDDSAFNRRTLSDLLSALPGVDIVGKASDGEEALKLAIELSPDLITLDLEMPRMDGFTFLRLLMARKPTPVIVVSGFAAKENVFRALELGALDFIAKPTRTLAADLGAIQQELAEKVALVRQLSPPTSTPARTGFRGRAATATGSFAALPDPAPVAAPGTLPKWLVVIASSTGGPTALLEVFAQLPASASAAVVVAQHMPERFTKTFAERLDRLSPFRVSEGADVQLLRPGHAIICPGGRCIEVVRRGAELLAKSVPALATDRYVPSGDRLFESAARAMAGKTIGVVLTGMGDDGAKGTIAIRDAGGVVLAESAESAVVYGMPGAAVRTGAVESSLPLRELSVRLGAMISS
jgi:two-component system chemotaxis response regulator CheB